MNRKRLHFLGPLVGLSLLVVSLMVVRHQLQNYSYRDVLASLKALPAQQVGFAIAFTSLGYLAMTGYDTLGFRYLRQRLPYPKIALTTFISCAFSNTIGFALLTGSAIRYRFYAGWGISAMSIAQIIAFANVSFWLGLLIVGGSTFLLAPLAIPAQLHLPFRTSYPLGLIFLALIGIYLIVSGTLQNTITLGEHWLRLPRPAVALAQIGVSSLDWSLAAAALYALLPATAALTFPAFLKIYLLAMAAGVLSNVPGGLGVFETVVILLLSAQISPAAVLASLLAYRGVYYFLPLAIAASLLGVHEIRQQLSRAN